MFADYRQKRPVFVAVSKEIMPCFHATQNGTVREWYKLMDGANKRKIRKLMIIHGSMKIVSEE